MNEPSRPLPSVVPTHVASWRSFVGLVAGIVVATVVAAGGCSEQIVETQAPLGGTCLACHDGITDVHPFFALACVDCHGGNDKIALPATGVNVRDQALLKQSHVLPLDSSMWWPNGIDDDDDGEIDEVGEFFDGRGFTDTATPFADARLAKKDQMDSEMNRDLNYLRFLNPGDLRVADASCGSRNRQANDAMVCHAEIVYDNRRSIMSLHSGVPAGATYGNAQLPLARDFGAAFASSAAGARYDARNPRIGRVGYVIDFDAIDQAFDKGFEDVQRNLTTGGFDRELLGDNNIDPNDNKFEAKSGVMFGDARSGADAKFAPGGGAGFTRTGQKYKFYIDNLDDPNAKNNRPVEVLQSIGNRSGRTWPDATVTPGLQMRLAKIVGEVVPALKEDREAPIENLFNNQRLTNPVDAALRNFRAYHSLNWWGPGDNFGFVDFHKSPNANDGPRPDPSDAELRNNNNPFGRGRPAGCTSCHVEYGKDGRNLEPVDRTVADNGRNPSTDLPFGIRTDKGERFYAKRHQLKRAVKTEQCGACHGFVTRVDVQALATYEQETDFTNIEKVNTIGDFEYQTPKGSTVRIFDNLAHYKNGRILNEGEGFSEDLNNNGELDTNLTETDLNGDGILQPNEDFNKNGVLDVGVAINEDKNGNGKLDIPDRVARSESFDGRQNRIIYGGGNGAVRLQDIHLERGFNCVDCHIQNDVHGDGLVYTRNWDSIQVECDDCHGTNNTEATLVFSGPNGGDSMEAERYTTPFGKPWFERRDGRIFQRSRVNPELGWYVPQLKSPKDNTSAYAHRQTIGGPAPDRDNATCAGKTTEDQCSAALCSWDGEACKGFDREYAHIAEPGEKGGLECYACHSSWQPNCLSCHIKMDVSKPKQEIWWGDDDVEDVFFQLFSYTRSPFYLGNAGNTEGNKIAPHRSTMQVHVSVVADVKGIDASLQIAESAVFSTKNNFSSMVSNPYFPHTVRTTETKQCARCHTLEDDQGRIMNDHLLTETFAHGTGRYQNIGDWAVAATTAGLDLLDMKKEAPTNLTTSFITFPGFDFSDNNANGELRRRVDFDLDGDAGINTAAFDVVLQRGVSFENGSGDIADVAIIGHAAGVSVVDVFGRDNAGMPPTEIARLDSLGPVRSIDIVDPSGSQSPMFIALTDEELAVVDYRPALSFDVLTGNAEINGVPTQNLLDPDAGTGQNDDDDFVFEDAGPDSGAQGMNVVGSIAHGLDGVTRVQLFGRFALITHANGLAVFTLGNREGAVTEIDLGPPLAQVTNFETSRPALDVAAAGRFAYVATGEGGVEIFDIGPAVYLLGDPLQATPIGVALLGEQQPADSRAVAIWGSRIVVADGRNGLRIVDVTMPADPRLEQTIANLGNGLRLNNATDVVMASVPTRTFAIVANGTNVHAINVTPVVDFRHELAAASANPDAFRGFRLSHERNDPLTPFDPKNASRQILTYPASGTVVSLARGFPLDNMADKSGRRLRDSWPIGAHPLEQSTIDRMRSVRVREVPGSVDTRGDGLGCVVRAGQEAGITPDPVTGRCIP